MKSKVETDKAPKATGPFSQAIVSGNFVFTAGQIYLTPEGKLLEGTVEEQTRRTLENLRVILEVAGSSFKDVVKATVYITDMSYFPEFNKIYGEYFADPFPARETVAVKALALGAWLEVSLIAVKS